MKTVYVGMSGGVDSSLTAALLKEQGFDVVGVYMKNWTQDFPGFECPWKEDLADAKRVAVQLGIPFEVFDFEKDYKEKVVDYMIEEYQSGRTPNPDVMCNQEIKFKVFLDTATEAGAEMIATGHYARVKDSELWAGVDPNKDQSYFLYRVTGDALQKTLMPLGDMQKSVVREEAAKRNLITADKPDSQGICFVGEVGVREFLSRYIETEPGPIIDQNGKEIGQHDGAVFYTIGQRQGLGVGGGLPYYVTKKDMASNTVFVTTDVGDDDLWRKEFELSNVHWIHSAPDPDANLQVRTRYRSKLLSCTLEMKSDVIKVILADPERAITAGQSAVIYDGDHCLGGGIISS